MTTIQDIAPEIREHLQTCLYGEGGGGVGCLHRKKSLQILATFRGYIYARLRRITLNVGILLILGRSFQWCWQIFPNLLESWKSREGVCWLSFLS